MLKLDLSAPLNSFTPTPSFLSKLDAYRQAGVFGSGGPAQQLLGPGGAPLFGKPGGVYQDRATLPVFRDGSGYFPGGQVQQPGGSGAYQDRATLAGGIGPGGPDQQLFGPGGVGPGNYKPVPVFSEGSGYFPGGGIGPGGQVKQPAGPGAYQDRTTFGQYAQKPALQARDSLVAGPLGGGAISDILSRYMQQSFRGGGQQPQPFAFSPPQSFGPASVASGRGQGSQGSPK